MNYSDPQDDGSPAGYACRNRVAEWACALMMVSFGITCVISPGTIATGAFRYMLATGMTQDLFAISCLTVGAVRVSALYFNGRGVPWSARIRAICAIFGGVLFAQLAWCLAFTFKDTGLILLSVGTYTILAGVEVYSTLRAGADVNEKVAANRRGSERTVIARIITNDTTEREPSGLSTADRHSVNAEP